MSAFILRILVKGFYNQMVDSTDYKENQIQKQESEDAVVDIRHFHCTKPQHTLADFNGEGNAHQKGKDINPCDDKCMIMPGELVEDRVNNEDQKHSEGTDHKEMKMLVGERKAFIVSDANKAVMYIRDPEDDFIYKCNNHTDSLLSYEWGRNGSGETYYFISNDMSTEPENRKEEPRNPNVTEEEIFMISTPHGLKDFSAFC